MGVDFKSSFPKQNTPTIYLPDADVFDSNFFFLQTVDLHWMDVNGWYSSWLVLE